MGVVPFIVNDENSTIVSNKSEFSLDNHMVLLQNVDEMQLKDIDDANTSYDLRVGDEYRDHRVGHATKLGDEDEIKLSPGSAIVIKTMESVSFPRTRFGQIVPKVKLLEKGVSNTTSKIDPGYEGVLTITLFNLGKTPVELKKGDKFCTLIIQSVNPGARIYNKPAKSIPAPEKKQGIFKRIGNLIESKVVLTNALLMLFTLILTIFNIISFF